MPNRLTATKQKKVVVGQNQYAYILRKNKQKTILYYYFNVFSIQSRLVVPPPPSYQFPPGGLP